MKRFPSEKVFAEWRGAHGGRLLGEWQWKIFSSRNQARSARTRVCRAADGAPDFPLCVRPERPEKQPADSQLLAGNRASTTVVLPGRFTRARMAVTRSAKTCMSARSPMTKAASWSIATHNVDNGDGWEREGEYPYFFQESRRSGPTRSASISFLRHDALNFLQNGSADSPGQKPRKADV